MDKIRRIHLFEIFLYAIVLITALCIPFFLGIFTEGRWSEAFFGWVRLLPFVIVFLLNNYLLVPRLLFKEKYLYYFLSCILIVVGLTYLSDLLFDLTGSFRPPFDRMQENFVPPDEGMPFRGRPPQLMKRPPHVFFNFGQAVISFLLIGFNTGIKSFVRWNEERIRQVEKDRQYFYTELAYLKHQISPHFLMNTLNNIHALIDINAERAKDAVIKLSRLMRYLLYEADVQKVSLKKEIEFIESYIELMRLRYDEEKLKVETVYPEHTDAIAVPSYLFLSFIENAFKHGINTDYPSFVKISFTLEKDRLTFIVCNNKSGLSSGIEDVSGIGLENVRKRLDLIYKNDYKLDIRSGENEYEIFLELPV